MLDPLHPIPTVVVDYESGCAKRCVLRTIDSLYKNRTIGYSIYNL